MTKVRDILGPDRDSEFLQSFVRVGLKADEEGDQPYKSVYTQQKPDLAKQISVGKSEGSDKTPRRAAKNVDWFQGLDEMIIFQQIYSIGLIQINNGIRQ